MYENTAETVNLNIDNFFKMDIEAWKNKVCRVEKTVLRDEHINKSKNTQLHTHRFTWCHDALKHGCKKLSYNC